MTSTRLVGLRAVSVSFRRVRTGDGLRAAGGEAGGGLGAKVIRRRRREQHLGAAEP
jgi:hypothetical protein